jgi:hypothetical protein
VHRASEELAYMTVSPVEFAYLTTIPLKNRPVQSSVFTLKSLRLPPCDGNNRMA